ncbi:hypothetical protein RB213_008700 [Colletotrichum asianum]
MQSGRSHFGTDPKPFASNRDDAERGLVMEEEEEGSGGRPRASTPAG